MHWTGGSRCACLKGDRDSGAGADFSRAPYGTGTKPMGGFVISGPSGNIFHAGDTGYGPHFKEIARRFSPIRVALLPMPFRPKQSKDTLTIHFSIVHMGPADAVRRIRIWCPAQHRAHFKYSSWERTASRCSR